MPAPARAPRRLTSADAPTNEYPWRPWSHVQATLRKMWEPENSPHHSIIGLTRSGKSFLAVNGILELAKYDRVLIVDTKGDDHSTNVGRVVKSLPRHTWYSAMGRRQDGPYEKWYRLIAPENRERANAIVGEALENAYDEGEWVIYFDETWEVTDHIGNNGLGLGSTLAKLWRKGGYRGVSVVAATQTPVAVPRLFYDQASFAWIGRIRDEDRQKRLLEIGGLSKQDLSVLSTLQRRQWFLAADNGEYFARTIVK
jgi:DNA helicase HerA-like ATPase